MIPRSCCSITRKNNRARKPGRKNRGRLLSRTPSRQLFSGVFHVPFSALPAILFFFFNTFFAKQRAQPLRRVNLRVGGRFGDQVHGDMTKNQTPLHRTQSSVLTNTLYSLCTRYPLLFVSVMLSTNFLYVHIRLANHHSGKI